MRKKFTTKKAISFILATAMVLGSLTACGGSDNSSKGGEEEANVAEDTGEKKILRMASEDPQVPLDMQLNTYSLIMKITDNITESLTFTNPDGTVVPVLLAEMPTLSEDKLEYSFTLKEGVKFHNDAPLTSEDVKYSLERLVSKTKMASLLEKVEGYEAYSNGEAEEITGIQVVDESHFVIKMAEIYTPFPAVLSTPYCAIYPKEACEAAGDEWGISELYGTGPFKLESYQVGVGAELSKFDGYHGEPAKLDGISYTFINDPNTGVLEYQKGNIDVVYLDSSLYPTYAEGELKDEVHSFQPVGGYYISLNVKDVPEQKVREALNYAIDRESLCESVLFGTAQPASSILSSALIGYNPDAEQYKYDPEKSKELLKEAGYADGYTIRTTVNTKYPTGLKIATALQAQVLEGGFNMEIEQVDSAAWTDMKKNGGVTCGIGNWYVDYNDPDSMLYPVSDGHVDINSMFWHNDEFKQLMIDGVQTEDPDERQEIYARADEILTHEENAIVMLYNETLFYLAKPYVEGFEVSATYRTMFGNADIVK